VSRTVVAVTNIPRPYRRALFDVLSRQLADRDIGFRVLYTSDPTKHVRRGANSAALADPRTESWVRGTTVRLSYDHVISIPTGLRKALAELEPACVVIGGFGADALLAASWCKHHGVPRVVWSGGWPGRQGSVGGLRLFSRKRVVRAADAFIAYGSAAADYLVDLGASRDRVFCAWNTVDLEGIAAAAQKARDHRQDLVEKYRLADRNLLYIGTLVDSKGVKELVRAALTMEAPGIDWTLHFAGAGPEMGALKTIAQEAGQNEHFRFHGLLPASDVAELLGLADGLLLPTMREAWGLVINEAMACGVPVVTTPWAGATRDLIEDGATGYVVEPQNIARLAELMLKLVARDRDCQEVGRAGAEAVRAKASLEKAAQGFVSGVECALARRANV
jgi:glycosyltransferase involved in cell wall biosynthesis